MLLDTNFICADKENKKDATQDNVLPGHITGKSIENIFTKVVNFFGDKWKTFSLGDFKQAFWW